MWLFIRSIRIKINLKTILLTIYVVLAFAGAYLPGDVLIFLLDGVSLIQLF
jgi:hypothetical protein